MSEPTPSSFGLEIGALYAPKEGSTDAQYEDAWATNPLPHVDPRTVAVSDGASSAIFARDWANRLVAAFTGEDSVGAAATDAQITEIVTREGARWRAECEKKATSWHAQEKLQNGSAATLLVVDFSAETRTWSAFAIGDVCLFLVRGGRLKYAFPVTKSAGFDDRPGLLSTEARAPLPTVKRFGNTIEAGDRFLLMTDALAAWFLTHFEKKTRPWETLPTDPDTFAAFIQKERDAARMKNDDATLVEIAVSAVSEP